MMRWLLLLALVAGCIDAPTVQEGPTGQIDGAVLNHILTPYGNATVALPALGLTTQTTPLGGFSFFEVPVGFHTVEVRLPDGTDREVVLVEEGRISKIILQVFPAPVASSYVADLSKQSVVDLAMPGEPCGECSWRAAINERRPDLVELIVVWDGHHPVVEVLETHLVVRLEDQDGTLLAILDRTNAIRGETFHMCTVVPGHAVPASAGSLVLNYAFDEDNELPHPDLRFESFLRLHYDDDQLMC